MKTTGENNTALGYEAPHSRRIRAGLRLARLSGARVLAENGSGKEVVRLRHASRDFEQIVNNKTTGELI